MGRLQLGSSVLLKNSVLVVVMFVISVRPAFGNDPDITTDFGINVTSAANLTFTGFRNLAPVPSGVFNITFAFVTEFPGLHGLAVAGAYLQFGPNSLNSLHSHPKGSEFFFVIDGSLDLGLVDTSNQLFKTTLRAGEAFVFPKGLLHFQINRSLTKSATVLAAFGSENPGRLDFPPAIFNSVPRIDTDILERAFDLDAKTVQKLLTFDFAAVSG